MKAWVVVLLGVILAPLFVLVFVPQLWAPTLLDHPAFSANQKLTLAPLPRPIQDKPDRGSAWPDIVAFGLQFTTPWGEPDEQRGVASRQFTFENGNRMVLASNQQPDAARLLLRILGPRDAAGRRKVFGEANIDSNYDLVHSILTTTPKPSAETLPSALAAQVILLSMKGRYVRELADGTITRFTTRDVGGFQFGDPAASHRIKIFFFDRRDHHYTLILSGRELTQSEIDALLASIIVL